MELVKTDLRYKFCKENRLRSCVTIDYNYKGFKIPIVSLGKTKLEWLLRAQLFKDFL